MDRNEFRKRMQDLKSYRQNNPDKGYWDWKVQAFGEGGPDKYFIGPPTEQEQINKQKQFAKEFMRPKFLVNEGEKAKVNPDFANYMYDFDFDQVNHEDPNEHKYTLTNYWKRAADARNIEANKYTTPYIPEKEIRLTTGRFNTGRISTNVLDSLLESSKRTGYPFVDALGLAARESGLGYARGHRINGSISNTDLLSNWQQIQTVYNTNKALDKFNSIYDKYIQKEQISNQELEFVKQFIANEQKEHDSTKPITENVYDNALKYFESGKYNPGDTSYMNTVRNEGKILMQDPAIKKWAKTAKFAEGGEVDDKQQQITNAITYALNRGNVDAAKSLMRRGTPNTNYYYPQSGAIDPVFSLYDTPVLGDAMTTTDAARYAMNGDWANAGLAMAGLILPGVVGKGIKKVNRHIPSVKGYKESVENQINRIMDPQDLQKQSDWNNMLYRSAEQVYEPDVINRAAATGTTDRLNRVRSMYENDLENMPKIRMTDELNGARGRVQLTKEAEQRYRQGIKPSDSDFEILVDRNIDPTQEVIDHELRHWNQYMEQGSPNINVMPTSTRSGVRPTSKNKLDPNHSDYYGKQGESEAYILNAYRDMKQKGYQINLKNFKKYYNSLKDIDTKKRAISQFSSLEDAYKWMQSMPLIGTAGVIAMNNKEQSN